MKKETFACHAREVCEQIESGELMLSVPISLAIKEDNKILKEISQLQDEIEKAISFHMGRVEGLQCIDPISELIRLPFHVCWFECVNISKEYSETYGVLATEIEEEIVLDIFCKKTNHKIWEIFGYSSLKKDTNNRISFCVGPKEIYKTDHSKHYTNFIDAITFDVGRFLSALNCQNVKRVEHKPDAALNKARQKRGKLPLFSFWTLELDFDRSQRGQSCGGTHASPRLHLRRGHPRQYAPGVWTWVQPHVVGNKNLGIVHKDYAMA